MKRALLSVLLIVAMLTIAACGGNSGNSAGSGGSGEAGSANSGNTGGTGGSGGSGGNGGNSGEVAELVFWDMMWGRSDSYPTTVQKLVEQFNNEHPNIHVTVQIIPWDNFYQQFLTAVTSGAAPDVSTGGFSQSIQYAAMDELIDLSSIVEEWKAEGFDANFPEGSLELHQYNGMQAGIPWIIDPRVITYRKDVFEQAGITELPSTWEEFFEAAEAIKSKTGMTPLVIPGDRDGAQVFLSMLFENGAGITDENGNPNFVTKGVEETLAYVQTLYEKGYIFKGTASYTDTDMDSKLLSGEAAMSYGALRTTVYNSGDPIAEHLGVLPSLKSKSDGTPRTLMWINPIVVYKQTKYPEESKIFVKWWVEHMLPLFTEGAANGYPAVKAMLQDEYFTREPYIEEAIRNAVPYGVPPVWPAKNLYTAWSIIEGENYLGMALQEVVTGNTNLAGIMEKYDKMIQQAFNETN